MCKPFSIALFLLSIFLVSPTAKAQNNSFSNLSYGKHSQNIFDLWLPQKSEKDSPLIIYIHGGGFTSGDKKDITKSIGFISKFNAQGIAVASINYRFLKDSSLQNIMKEDIAGFVQFIRYNAKKYKINKELIVASGSSAGGSASLWLGTHDDIKDDQALDPIKKESSRILAFAHINAQAGYDFMDWYEYFGKKLTNQFMKQQVWTRYHLKSFEDLQTTAGVAIREDLDSVENMDSDDAAMFLYNSYDKKEVKDDDYNYDYFIHGPHHANVLAKRAKEVGLHRKVIIKANGNTIKPLVDSLVKFFKEKIATEKILNP